MDERPDAPEPSLWPLLLWGLTSFTLFALTALTQTALSLLISVIEKLEIKSLPFLCEAMVKYRAGLWLLALAASLSGLPYARRRDAERTQRWALVLILLLLTVGAGILTQMILPLVSVQITLAK